MKQKDTHTLTAFVGADGFGADHRLDSPPGSPAADAFGGLATLVVQLRAAFAAQDTGRRKARRAMGLKGDAEAALRRLMLAISRTGRVLVPAVAGADEAFRMPRANDADLLAGARSFVVAAAPLAEQFIAHRLPDDFLAQLARLADNFEQTTNDARTARGEHIAATANIATMTRDGKQLLRRLDAIIRNQYADKSAVLEEWRAARHVEKSPRPAEAAGQPATADASAPARTGTAS